MQHPRNFACGSLWYVYDSLCEVQDDLILASILGGLANSEFGRSKEAVSSEVRQYQFGVRCMDKSSQGFKGCFVVVRLSVFCI